MKKTIGRLFGAVLLLAASLQTQSQTTSDSVVQVTADAAGLTPVDVTSLPGTGTFWILQPGSKGQLISVPFPFLPPDDSSLPIYQVTNNVYLVDDTRGSLNSSGRTMNRAQAATALQTQSETMAALIDQLQAPNPADGSGTNGGFQPDGIGFTPIIFTNGLWIEVLTTNGAATNLWLRLHGTGAGNNYQLLSTLDLLSTNWDLGQILFNAADDYTDFSPIPTTNAQTFFRAHYANPVMRIVDWQNANEPDPTNSDAGQIGVIHIDNEGWATNDVTVYYSIGGTAVNGVDYSNLTGVATILAGQTEVEFYIQPIADGLKPDQTVILTLLQNTNYLIDPNSAISTNIISANPEVVPLVFGDKKFPCPNKSLTFGLDSDAIDPRGLPLTYSILTYPTNGSLDTSALPQVTYTPTNCFEGVDSFTFTASNGQFTSAPATVALGVSDRIFANPVSAQTCRGVPVSFSLSSGDICGETPSYYLLSQPAHGVVSNTTGYSTNRTYIYTSTDTNFTGIDSFNYIAVSGCGADWSTNTVTISVGDVHISPVSQVVRTGTNQSLALTLSAINSGGCTETNYFTYVVASNPTNGTLSGTPPNLTYTPKINFEGLDAFQFVANDGVWSNNSPATVTIYVVAGPQLTAEQACYPVGVAIRLDWSLDEIVSNLWLKEGLNITNYVISRANYPGGSYTPINTNSDATQMSYVDTTATPGQAYNYVVKFGTHDGNTGINYLSLPSNPVLMAGLQPIPLIITPTNFWNVVTNLSHPTNVVRLQAPLSDEYPGQYPGMSPLPNAFWANGATWSNHITLFLPTNSVALSQVKYSIAIDNTYWLYLNNSTNYIDTLDRENGTSWPAFKSFQSVAPNLLHYGTNDIGVVIADNGGVNYFSMVVTTNACDP